MSKFGELIDAKVPVLIDFFAEADLPSTAMNEVIKEVATTLGDQARVIKIDVEKNKELADALRVKGLPTFMIYKDGQMVWRQSGEVEVSSLVTELQKHV